MRDGDLLERPRMDEDVNDDDDEEKNQVGLQIRVLKL